MSENNIGENNKIEWCYKIPLFSLFILRGVLTVFLIPAIFIFLLFMVLGAFNDVSISSLTPDIYYAASFVGLLIFITFLVLVVLYHDGFEIRYKIDDKGVYQYSGSRSKKVNRAAIAVGILARSPQATGAGLLAYSGEDRFISWKEAKVINIDPKKRYIYVSRGKIAIGPIGIFCTKDNFDKVVSLINSFKDQMRIQ